MIKAFFIDSSQALYTSEEFSWFQKYWLEEGVFASSDGTLGLNASQNTPQGMSVVVPAGNALVELTKNSATWKVIVMSDSQVTVPIAANTSGSNRIDAIVVRVSSSTEPNTLKTNVATIERVAGTGTSALSDAAITAALGTDGWVRLADVTVANNATQILTANITDRRVRVKSNEAVRFSPKTLEFRGYATDPAGADLVEGLMWFNTTDHTMKYYANGQVSNMVTVMMTTSGNQISGTNKVVDNADTMGVGKVIRSAVKFGGSGVDGPLAISSGTTTIDLAGASYVVKNYTSIAITGTGKLAFINPAATGTKVYLKSQGDITLTSSQTPMIDCSGLGAAVGSVPANIESSSHSGSGTNGGTQFTQTLLYGITAEALLMGSGIISCGYPGANGTAGQQVNGVGTPGSAGIGGRGGGALDIECGGTWTFTTANGISVAGADGGNGGDGVGATGGGATGGGGGGGGGAGMCRVRATAIGTNTGTVNVSTGKGGQGGSANFVSGSANSGSAGNGGGAGGGYAAAGGAGKTGGTNAGTQGTNGGGSSGGGITGGTAYSGAAQGTALATSGASVVSQNYSFA